MNRKVVGVSSKLHKDLNELASNVNLPMTVVMENLIAISGQVEWDKVKAQYDQVKPTWSNMRRVVNEYLEKYPQASDKKLSELSGYTIAQVETITHSAHKRCIAYLKKSQNVKKCSAKCNVSIQFAARIKDQMLGKRKMPRSEKYLYD